MPEREQSNELLKAIRMTQEKYKSKPEKTDEDRAREAQELVKVQEELFNDLNEWFGEDAVKNVLQPKFELIPVTDFNKAASTIPDWDDFGLMYRNLNHGFPVGVIEIPNNKIILAPVNADTLLIWRDLGQSSDGYQFDLAKEYPPAGHLDVLLLDLGYIVDGDLQGYADNAPWDADR